MGSSPKVFLVIEREWLKENDTLWEKVVKQRKLYKFSKRNYNFVEIVIK